MRARTIGRLYEPVPQLRTPPPWDEGSVSLPCETQGRAHRLHVALVAPRDSSAVVYPWRSQTGTREPNGGRSRGREGAAPKGRSPLRRARVRRDDVSIRWSVERRSVAEAPKTSEIAGLFARRTK